MRVYRDRWGTKWVRHNDPGDDDFWFESFSWFKLAHVLMYLWQAGQLPEWNPE